LSVFVHFEKKIFKILVSRSWEKVLLVKKLKDGVLWDTEVWKCFGLPSFEAMLLSEG